MNAFPSFGKAAEQNEQEKIKEQEKKIEGTAVTNMEMPFDPKKEIKTPSKVLTASLEEAIGTVTETLLSVADALAYFRDRLNSTTDKF